jgi:hypothetical protein
LSAIRVTTPIATLMFSAEYSPNGELSSVRTPVQREPACERGRVAGLSEQPSSDEGQS